MLEPEYVAEQVVRAVRRGDTMLVLPAFPYLVFLSRVLLSPKLFDYVMYDVCGIGKTMDHFRGREKDFKRAAAAAGAGAAPGYASKL